MENENGEVGVLSVALVDGVVDDTDAGREPEVEPTRGVITFGRGDVAQMVQVAATDMLANGESGKADGVDAGERQTLANAQLPHMRFAMQSGAIVKEVSQGWVRADSILKGAHGYTVAAHGRDAHEAVRRLYRSLYNDLWTRRTVETIEQLHEVVAASKFWVELVV
jgi:hypothetical protein